MFPRVGYIAGYFGLTIGLSLRPSTMRCVCVEDVGIVFYI